MNQINEADESMVETWYQSHQAYVRDWITCPTCDGSGITTRTESGATEREHLEGLREAPVPCPDCVDGMTPSPELVERVTDAITDVGPDQLIEAYAVAALLASRREGETH